MFKCRFEPCSVISTSVNAWLRVRQVGGVDVSQHNEASCAPGDHHVPHGPSVLKAAPDASLLGRLPI
jgi:hypothetical protein